VGAHATVKSADVTKMGAHATVKSADVTKMGAHATVKGTDAAIIRALCAVIDTGAYRNRYPPVSIGIPPGMNIEARGIDWHTPRYEHRSTRYRLAYPPVCTSKHAVSIGIPPGMHIEARGIERCGLGGKLDATGSKECGARSAHSCSSAERFVLHRSRRHGSQRTASAKGCGFFRGMIAALRCGTLRA
jgi:hypothetical protein